MSNRFHPPYVPRFLAPPDRDETFSLPRGAGVGVLVVLQCLYPQKQSVGSPGDNRIYNDHRPAPFSRAFWLVGTTKVYSGVGADIVMDSIFQKFAVGEIALFDKMARRLSRLGYESMAQSRRAP
jgi:hypothetical protein